MGVMALPSASNVAMLAERFGADNGRIARIIFAVDGAGLLHVFRVCGIDDLTGFVAARNEIGL